MAAPSRREALRTHIEELSALKRLATQELSGVKRCLAQSDRQRCGLTKHKSFVLLKVIQEVSGRLPVAMTIATLLLPPLFFECRLAECTAEQWLERHLTEPAVLLEATDTMDSNPPKKSLLRALRLVAEFGVYRSLLTLREKGVSGAPEQLLFWLHRFWPEAYGAACYRVLLGRVSNNAGSRAKWLQRFRRFWRVSLGKLPVHGPASADVLARRVRRGGARLPQKLAHWSRFWRHFWGRNSSPFSGPSCSVCVGKGSVWGAFCGPGFGVPDSAPTGKSCLRF